MTHEGHCEICEIFYDIAEVDMDCPSCGEPIMEVRVTECGAGSKCRSETHHFGIDMHVEELA